MKIIARPEQDGTNCTIDLYSVPLKVPDPLSFEIAPEKTFKSVNVAFFALSNHDTASPMQSQVGDVPFIPATTLG